MSGEEVPETLFTLTVFTDGTVAVESSRDIPTPDFGEAIIAVGEAFRDGKMDMVRMEGNDR